MNKFRSDPQPIQSADSVAAGSRLGASAPTSTEAASGIEPSSPTASPQGPSGPADSAAPGLTAAGDRFYSLALRDLGQKRSRLEAEITVLEQRRDKLEEEIASHFAGSSDALARRVQGFQDYLVGALQELANRAEALNLSPRRVVVQPSPMDAEEQTDTEARRGDQEDQGASRTAGALFGSDAALIRSLLAGFTAPPDAYAPPWQLRRSLGQDHLERLEDWFLAQDGRGAQASSGNRSRNVLVTAGAISILTELYGERFQTLVLAGGPERLGEWRRGLQDSLSLSREDFGPNSGIGLFERPDALIDRADRLEERGELPFIVVDAAEQAVEIPVLQFPLWLAFAADARELALDEAGY